MAISDIEVQRVYSCTNCEAKVAYNQKATEDFKRRCPFCKKSTLLIEMSNCSVSVMVDSTVPKTVGSLADKGRQKKEKEGSSIEASSPIKKPWWRKNKKIDYSVLKNPTKYIQEGRI